MKTLSPVELLDAIHATTELCHECFDENGEGRDGAEGREELQWRRAQLQFPQSACGPILGTLAVALSRHVVGTFSLPRHSALTTAVKGFLQVWFHLLDRLHDSEDEQWSPSPSLTTPFEAVCAESCATGFFHNMTSMVLGEVENSLTGPGEHSQPGAGSVHSATQMLLTALEEVLQRGERREGWSLVLLLSDLASVSPPFLLALATSVSGLLRLLPEVVLPAHGVHTVEVYVFLLYQVVLRCRRSPALLERLASWLRSEVEDPPSRDRANGFLWGLCTAVQQYRESEPVLSNVLGLLRLLVSSDTVLSVVFGPQDGWSAGSAGPRHLHPHSSLLGEIVYVTTPILFHTSDALAVVACDVLRCLLRGTSPTALPLSTLEWVEESALEALHPTSVTSERAEAVVGILNHVWQPLRVGPAEDSGPHPHVLHPFFLIQHPPVGVMEALVGGGYFAYCVQKSIASLSEVASFIARTSRGAEGMALSCFLTQVEALVVEAQRVDALQGNVISELATEVARRVRHSVGLFTSPLQSANHEEEEERTQYEMPHATTDDAATVGDEVAASASLFESIGPSSLRKLLHTASFLLRSSSPQVAHLFPVAVQLLAEIHHHHTGGDLLSPLSPREASAVLCMAIQLLPRYHPLPQHSTLPGVCHSQFAGLLRSGLVDTLWAVSNPADLPTDEEKQEAAVTASLADLRVQLVSALTGEDAHSIETPSTQRPLRLDGVRSCAGLVCRLPTLSLSARVLFSLAVFGSAPVVCQDEIATMLAELLRVTAAAIESAQWTPCGPGGDECGEKELKVDPTANSTQAPGHSSGRTAGCAFSEPQRALHDSVESALQLLACSMVWYDEVADITVDEGQATYAPPWSAWLLFPGEGRCGALAYAALLRDEKGIRWQDLLARALRRSWLHHFASVVAVALFLGTGPAASSVGMKCTVSNACAEEDARLWVAQLAQQDSDAVAAFFSALFSHIQSCTGRAVAGAAQASYETVALLRCVRLWVGAVEGGLNAAPLAPGVGEEAHLCYSLKTLMESHLVPSVLALRPQRRSYAAAVEETARVLGCVLSTLSSTECSGSDTVLAKWAIGTLLAMDINVKGEEYGVPLYILQLLHILLSRCRSWDITYRYYATFLALVRAVKSQLLACCSPPLPPPSSHVTCTSESEPSAAPSPPPAPPSNSHPVCTVVTLCGVIEYSLLGLRQRRGDVQSDDDDGDGPLFSASCGRPSWFTAVPVHTLLTVLRERTRSSRSARPAATATPSPTELYLLSALETLLCPLLVKPLTSPPSQPVTETFESSAECDAVLSTFGWCLELLLSLPCSHHHHRTTAARVLHALLFLYRCALAPTSQLLALYTLLRAQHALPLGRLEETASASQAAAVVEQGWELAGLLYASPLIPWTVRGAAVAQVVETFLSTLDLPTLRNKSSSESEECGVRAMAIAVVDAVAWCRGYYSSVGSHPFSFPLHRLTDHIDKEEPPGPPHPLFRCVDDANDLFLCAPDSAKRRVFGL